MFEPTKEQFTDWKKKHGEVYECIVGDKVEKGDALVWSENAKRCYLRKPTRQELGYSMSKTHNPLLSDEVLLKNCWLGGDMEIQTDDAYFLGARIYLGNLIERKEGELKKL